jgi:hypothetical protein
MIFPQSALFLLAAHPLVSLRIDACPEVNGADVSRIVEIELGEALVSESPDPDTQLTVATVRCEGGLANIDVADPLTGKSLGRQIDLPALAPKARTRLLGLAVAELVAASWVELEANPRPAVMPTGPPPKPELQKEAAQVALMRSLPSTRAEVAADLRVSSAGIGYGGTLGVSHDFVTWLGWTIRATAHYGSASTTLGRLELADVTGMSDLHLATALGPFNLRGGLGGRVGPLWLVGVPAPGSGAQGGTVTGLWAGPVIVAGVRYVISRAIAIELCAEGGWIVSPTSGRVAGMRAISVEGPWATASLGATLGLTR